MLHRWKANQTTVGLYFAARGGTAASTMLARITGLGATIVFRNEAKVLRYGLHKARFEYGPVQVLLRPSREGMISVEGLHIWLESGHWLFVCDGERMGQDWLESGDLALAPKKPHGLLESQPEEVFRG